MYGPALPSEIVREKSREVFLKDVEERLPVRLDHQIRQAAKGALD